MPGPYQPLAAYLAVQARDRVELTFRQVATVLGGPLPPDVYLVSWWRRPGAETIAAALAAVGWRVARIEPQVERVLFRREPPAGSCSSAAPRVHASCSIQ